MNDQATPSSQDGLNGRTIDANDGRSDEAHIEPCAGAVSHEAATDSDNASPHGAPSPLPEGETFLHEAARALIAPDPPTFIGTLIGLLNSSIIAAGSDKKLTGRLLRVLARALADGLDEELAFDEFIDALDRKDLGSREIVAIAAAFLIRIIIATTSSPAAAATHAPDSELMGAARAIVHEARDAGNRAWQLLPEFAAAIAEQGLPATDAATALGQLWRQFSGLQPDRAAPDPAQLSPIPIAWPRPMVRDGAIEIFIIGR